MNAVDAPGVFIYNRHDGGRSEYSESGECLEVGLQAGSSGGIGTGYGQGSFIVFHKYLENIFVPFHVGVGAVPEEPLHASAFHEYVGHLLSDGGRCGSGKTVAQFNGEVV